MNQLPRSLRPLPGESLAGYLLRSAHRLGLSPQQIAVHIGLTEKVPMGRYGLVRVPARFMVGIDPERKNRIAQATGLSITELDGLLLGSLAGQYPPLAPRSWHGKHQDARQITAAEPWLLKTSTRYCPQCLAGDGSIIQQRHGGPWRLIWQLPIVFACLKHRRFLEHLCPRCRAPVHGALKHRELLPQMRRSGGWHPAQCRAPQPGRTVCPGRLDQATHPGPPATALLTLQHKLLSVLQPDLRAAGKFISLGEQTGHTRYLADLQATAALVSGSWPAAIHLCHQQLRAAAPYLTWRKNWISERRKTRTHPEEIVLHTQLPLAPKACAAILSAADQILSNPDPAVAIKQLIEAAKAAPLRIAWARHLTSPAHPGTQAFQQALDPITTKLLPVHMPPYKPPARRPNPEAPQRQAPRRATFSARHIPPMAPLLWHRQLFARHGIPATRAARQWISIHLTHLVTPGSLTGACYKLGLSHHVLQYPNTPYGQWLRNPDTAKLFTQAITELADAFDTETDYIDYRHRRLTLAEWTLPAEDWHQMATGLPEHPARQRQHTSYNVKRQVASLLIWTEITQCNPTNAQFLPPHGSRARRNIIDWQKNSKHGPTSSALHAHASSYAHILATTIDAKAPRY